MTPLQTPPPISAPLPPAPPALKQQNLWITDESLGDDIDTTPSVSFPLLMPQRSMPPPPRISTALSNNEPSAALPAPSLQPQSFEFLKFPALKRERESRFTTAAPTIPQPIPIRPSECFRGRSPSLQLIIDNELNNNEVSSEESIAASRVHQQRPPLRIQPLKSGGAETPSHLARRGTEERTYLENQLRAESSLRRTLKKRWQNEELAPSQKIVIENGEDAQQNDEISALMEKFTDFQLNNEDCLQRWAPARNKRLPGSCRENVAPSPPIILQKSLQRSVSALIADSRGQEDDDACVLYFPDGLPLVDECNEVNIMSRNNSLPSLEQCNSFDSYSKCCGANVSPNTHECTEGSTPFGTISCHSTPNSVECQPVLGGEASDGDRGPGHFLKNTKKMMLRPKMSVRPKTPAKLKSGEEEAEKGTVPDQIDLTSRLFDIDCPEFSAIPDLEESFVSLEADALQEVEVEDHPGPSFLRSFQRLDSDATIVRKNGALDDGTLNCTTETFECPTSAAAEANDGQAGWNYSSPEPIRRYPFRANDSIPPPHKETTPVEPFQLMVLKEPLSESNYCTPNQSNCTVRKQLAVKPSGVLDTLPELFLPSLDKISQPPSFDDDLSDVAKKL